MMQGFELFPRGASSVAGGVDALHFYLVATTGTMALLVALVVLLFCVRYRRRPGNERGAAIHGLVRLELLWSGIPLLVFLSFFAWGTSLYLRMRRMPEEGMRVDVAAKQWMWKLQHPTGQREINALHVPIDTNVLLTMTSEDVIHSFYVPAFRVKFDVLPGRYSQAWFRATELGRFHLFCAEYCGTKHSQMIGEVVVLEPTAYEEWLSGQPARDPIEAGKALFEAQRCDTCHRSTPDQRGPVLDGIFGTTVALADGSSVVADEVYLRESIVAPAKRITKGFQPLMPTYAGQIDEQDLSNLIAFLKSLPATEPEGDER